jgi:PEP-CTERM motif
MKRFVISLILVFALTSHAYGMGWLGGGHNDNGSVVKTSGNAKSGTTGTTGNNNGGNNWINNGPNNSGFIATTSTTYGQQGQSGSNTHAVAEPLTLLLLGSGLIGLVAFRKKFKK